MKHPVFTEEDFDAAEYVGEVRKKIPVLKAYLDEQYIKELKQMKPEERRKHFFGEFNLAGEKI